MFLEHRDRERSITGADVDERANAGEVVALEDADVGDGAVRLQRLAEFRERLRVGGEVVEEIHAELRAGLRVAGRKTLGQAGPNLPERAARILDETLQRTRPVARQQRGQPRRTESPYRILGHDAE